MGTICSKYKDCFGSSSSRNNNNNHHHQDDNNNHYHHFDSGDDNRTNNSSKNNNKKSPVVYSHLAKNLDNDSPSTQLQKNHKNYNNSSQQLSDKDGYTNLHNNNNNNNHNNNKQQQYDDEDDDQDQQSQSQQSQQRIMKKIDSNKYLLKHSNLSCIIEEDEQHKDSLKLMESKKLKHQNNELKTIDSINNITDNSFGQKSSLFNLQSVENNNDNNDKLENNNNDNNNDEVKENNEETIEKNQIFPLIHSENIGQNIEQLLPNYKQLTEQALQNFCEIIKKHAEQDNYILENDQQEEKIKGMNVFSKIYMKPADDGKYKYFKIRTDYNIYKCNAREYLQFTGDPIQSKANNSSLDDFIIISSYNDYHIMYLTYKKVLMCSPRDFIYLKYNKQINHNTYITVQFSIDISTYPVFPNKERGIIILSGSLITEHLDQNQNQYIRLQNYTESNLKLTLNHKIMKSSTVKELKKYILNLQDLFVKNKL